jgi:hypothetical protein
VGLTQWYFGGHSDSPVCEIHIKILNIIDEEGGDEVKI